MTSIQPVTENRDPNVSQMNPNLVRSAGLGVHLQKAKPLESLGDLIHRFCIATALMSRANGHFVALVRVMANRKTDPVAVEVFVANGNGQILFADLSRFELRGKFEVHGVGLGDRDDAAGVSVESMNDPGRVGPPASLKA